MKHLKTYEEVNNYSPFVLSKNSCWYINGNNIEIINIYNQIINQLKYKKDKKIFENTTLIHSLTNDYKDAVGVYLYNEDIGINKGITYYVIRKQFSIPEQHKDARGIAMNVDSTYRGELKLVNDIVMVDTLQIDIEKYNL